MPRLLVLCIIATASCRLDLEPRPGTIIQCATASDCPTDYGCAVLAGQCFPSAQIEEDGPRLLGAAAADERHVLLSFDETLGTFSGSGVLDPASYAITGLSVFAAALVDDQRVLLLTSEHIGGETYVARVNEGVCDVYGNGVDPEASTATFVGAGVPPDRAPPQLLQPATGARLIGPSVTFAWSRPARATSYRLEVALDAAFTTVVHSVPALSVETAQVTLTEAVRYYWRVRADVTAEGSYASGSFDLMDDTVYVYCDDDLLCDPTSAVGNKTKPAVSVSQSLALAQSLGLHTIKIAGRPTPYSEGPLAIDGGLSILGGFSPDFSVRDAAAIPTTLTGLAPTFITLAALDSPVTLDGLRIVGLDIGTGLDSTAVLVFDAGALVTIKDCEITGGEVTGGTSRAMQVLGTAQAKNQVRVERSVLRAGGGGVGIALRVVKSTITVVDSQLFGGPSPQATAIKGSEATGEVSGCPLIIAGPAPRAMAIDLDGSTVSVHDNARIAGIAGPTSTFRGDVQTFGSANTFARNGIGPLDPFAVSVSTNFTQTAITASKLGGPSATAETSTFDGDVINVPPVTVNQSGATPGVVRVQAFDANDAIHLTNVTITVGDATIAAQNAATMGMQANGINYGGGNAVIDRLVATVGTVSSVKPITAARAVLLSALAFGGTLLDSSLTTTGQIAGDDYALRLEGLAQAAGPSPVIARNVFRASGGSGATQRVVSIEDHGVTFTQNIVIGDGAPASSVGLTVAYTSGGSRDASYVNNVVRAAASTTGSDDSVGVKVLASSTAAQTGRLTLTNNTIVTGASPSSGRAVALLVANPAAVASLPQIWLTNNVFVTPPGTGREECVREDTGGITSHYAAPDALANNVFIGCSDAAYSFLPNGPAPNCESVRYCTAGADLDNPTYTTHGPSGSTRANTALAAVSDAHFSSYPLEPWSFDLTASSPAELVSGGLLTCLAVCGPAADQQCDSVSDDIASRPRPCPAGAISAGAYQR